jgi:hypothetical protein
MTYRNKAQKEIKYTYSVKEYARDSINAYAAINLGQLLDASAEARSEGNNELADRILEGLPEQLELVI